MTAETNEIGGERYERERKGLGDDAHSHGPVDDRLIWRARRYVHHIRIALFGAQGKGGRTIGDEVEPEQLDSVQGRGQPCQGSDEDNRDLIVFMIKRSGLDLELLQADNGKIATELAETHVPDLILMDMQMPVMDGFTAVKIIKANPAIQHIPIIAFTAQTRTEDKVLTKSIGCVEHYSKPMDPDELLKLIRKYTNL